MLSKLKIKIQCLIIELKLLFHRKLKTEAKDAVEHFRDIDPEKEKELKDFTNIK